MVLKYHSGEGLIDEESDQVINSIGKVCTPEPGSYVDSLEIVLKSGVEKKQNCKSQMLWRQFLSLSYLKGTSTVTKQSV